MVPLIDLRRDSGGEPIGAVVPIAPSTYFLRERTSRIRRRAQRDDELRAAIQRVGRQRAGVRAAEDLAASAS